VGDFANDVLAPLIAALAIFLTIKAANAATSPGARPQAMPPA